MLRRLPAALLIAATALGATLGSASVVVSPSARPSAMSRSNRRMIFPERVLGRSAANRI